MRIGMIGLGRMGGNIARRLSKGGHQCIVFDRNRETVDALAKEGPLPAYSLKELVEKLSAPRAVWVMLPFGGPHRGRKLCTTFRREIQFFLRFLDDAWLLRLGCLRWRSLFN
jgi:6-phosphogluconate dehydrogenase (decarboxylating)